MAKEILWSEDGEKAYGWKNDFKDAKDFIETVKNNHDGEPIEVIDVKVETCITASKEIRPDMLTPLTGMEITIDNFYTGIIEYAEVKGED